MSKPATTGAMRGGSEAVPRSAARRGPMLGLSTVGFAGSKSQQNVQHQGFDLLYTRAILVRQP